MKAISQTTFGDPSVLQIVEIDAPVPIPTEVLIRVAAVGLNPVETAIRSGGFALLGEPPFVLGWDVSGVVESVVPGVTRFRWGTRCSVCRSSRALRAPMPNWWLHRLGKSHESLVPCRSSRPPHYHWQG